MVTKYFRRISIGAFCSLTILLAAFVSAEAQTVFVLPLRAPNYSDATEVGRHIAFSMYFAELVQNAYDAAPPKECRLKIIQHFPDLALGQRDPSVLTDRCHTQMAQLLATADIGRSIFDGAVQRALSEMARISDISRYFRANLNPSFGFDEVRLSVLSRLALKHLYPDDPVLTPLLRFDEWAASEAKSYDEFKDWVASQRRTFQYQLKPYSNPILPSPQRPKVDYARGISVSVPSLQGRTFILVRCDSVRDPNCNHQIASHLCRKRLNEARAGTRNYDPTWPRCSGAIGQIVVLRGWLAIDSDDADIVKDLYEELSSRRPRASEYYSSLIEFAVLVTVK